MNEIKYLIVTHFHPDHMGIAQELVDLGVKLIVFEEQKSYTHCSDSIFAKDKIVRFKPIVDDEVFYLSCAESRNFLSKIGISGEVIHTIGHSEDIADRACTKNWMPRQYNQPFYYWQDR